MESCKELWDWSWTCDVSNLQTMTIEILLAVILALIAISVAIGFYYKEKRERKEPDRIIKEQGILLEQENLKQPRVRNEKEPQSLDNLLKLAEKECFVLAVTANTFTTSIQKKIVDMINKRNIVFTFVIPHPNSDLLKFSDGKCVSASSRNDILTQFPRFRDMYEQLDDDKKGNLIVMLHHMPLLYSSTVIDPSLPHAQMDLSLFDYNDEAHYRTNLKLSKKYNSKIFSKYYRSFENVLNDKKTVKWNFEDFINLAE